MVLPNEAPSILTMGYTTRVTARTAQSTSSIPHGIFDLMQLVRKIVLLKASTGTSLSFAEQRGCKLSAGLRQLPILAAATPEEPSVFKSNRKTTIVSLRVPSMVHLYKTIHPDL
jgi:hypothetical protein